MGVKQSLEKSARFSIRTRLQAQRPIRDRALICDQICASSPWNGDADLPCHAETYGKERLFHTRVAKFLKRSKKRPAFAGATSNKRMT